MHQAAVSKAIQQVLARGGQGAKQTLDLLRRANVSLETLGQEVNAALGPCESPTNPPRVQEAFSAFWEASGVVMLDPQVPNPNELASRFIPALDKFLVASSINVHEPLDGMDARKRAFMSRVQQLHRLFRDEVVSVVALSCQFSDGLEALLESQRLVRPVSKDEHVIKATWMHERFVTLLEKLLASTKKTVVAMQQAMLESESVSMRARRMAPLFALKDEDIWRAEKQANANFAKAKSKVKRKPVQALVEPDWIRESQLAEAELNGLVLPTAATTTSCGQRRRKTKTSAAKRELDESGSLSSSEEPVYIKSSLGELSDDGSSELHPPPLLAVPDLAELQRSKKHCPVSATVLVDYGPSGTVTACPPPLAVAAMDLSDSAAPPPPPPLFLPPGPLYDMFDEQDDFYAGLDSLILS